MKASPASDADKLAILCDVAEATIRIAAHKAHSLGGLNPPAGIFRVGAQNCERRVLRLGFSRPLVGVGGIEARSVLPSCSFRGNPSLRGNREAGVYLAGCCGDRQPCVSPQFTGFPFF